MIIVPYAFKTGYAHTLLPMVLGSLENVMG